MGHASSDWRPSKRPGAAGTTPGWKGLFSPPGARAAEGEGVRRKGTCYHASTMGQMCTELLRRTLGA